MWSDVFEFPRNDSLKGPRQQQEVFLNVRLNFLNFQVSVFLSAHTALSEQEQAVCGGHPQCPAAASVWKAHYHKTADKRSGLKPSITIFVSRGKENCHRLKSMAPPCFLQEAEMLSCDWCKYSSSIIRARRLVSLSPACPAAPLCLHH